MGSWNQAAATFGAGIYLSLGLVGLMSTTFVNQATTLGLDPFLRLWTETILALVFAFVLIIASFLIGARTGMGSVIGGVLGALASIFGAINAIFLLSLTAGILPSSFGGLDIQLSLAYSLLSFATLLVLAVGLPICLVGSFQHLQEHEEAIT